MSRASDLERQMLELINEERTSRGLNPVELELRLNESSEEHSQWMLEEDRFSHTGEGGSSAGDRMRDADFDFDGNWRWGENIAYQSERGEPGLAADVEDLHNSLMNSSGHRANILNPHYEVVGLGIEIGEFNGREVVIVTQNFASTDAELQIDAADDLPEPPAPSPEPEQPSPEPETPEPETSEPVPEPEPKAEPEPEPEPKPEPEPETPDVVAEESDSGGIPSLAIQLQILLAGLLTDSEDTFQFKFESTQNGETVTVSLGFDDVLEGFFDDLETIDDAPAEPADIMPSSDGIEDEFQFADFQFTNQWDCFA